MYYYNLVIQHRFEQRCASIRNVQIPFLRPGQPSEFSPQGERQKAERGECSEMVERAVNEAVCAIEEDGAEGKATRLLAQQIFRLRQQVVRFRRLCSPMREVLDLLLETATIVTPPLLPYFRDVMDHVIRTELTDNVRDLSRRPGAAARSGPTGRTS
jgi:hypothetical protein